MLIPSIDLMGGRVVQLEQGSRLVFETKDIDGWLERFAAFPIVQLIDLDAAMGRGDHDAIVQSIAARRSCQIGGGVRSIDRAARLIEAGATRVIVGSAFFDERGVRADVAEAFNERLGAASVMAAVDSRGGSVVIHGWRTVVPVTPVEAVRALEPFVGGFLYTHVDTEGLLRGLDPAAAQAIRSATTRDVVVAGGIRSLEEVDRLDAKGIDAVVGMAVYRGLIDLASANVTKGSA